MLKLLYESKKNKKKKLHVDSTNNIVIIVGLSKFVTKTFLIGTLRVKSTFFFNYLQSNYLIIK